jgi:transposase
VSDMKVTLIGVDLAKTIFQVCGVNQAGKVVFNRQIKRVKLVTFLAQYPGVNIAMEACSGSNYWGRELEAREHQVLLIPPQHVKPFVKGNKNDRNDAFAICEAARRPHMRFVRPRTLAQTDTMLVHRILERRINERTGLINQLRGLLNEYGIIVARGKEKLRNELSYILEDADNGLTVIGRQYIRQQLEEWRVVDEAIAALEKAIKVRAKQSEQSQRLMTIRGVGEKISTAAEVFVGDGSGYKNGRHFAANLGLVPKEHSSGGKQRFGRITKRGNRYLRRLLIQGAWSVIRYADQGNDRLSRWARQLMARRGKHKTAIAVANKLARIIWAISYHQTEYKAA